MVRKIRARLVLQLRAEGLSGRAIAGSQGMSRKSVTAVLDAADRAGIGWDEIAERSEGPVALEQGSKFAIREGGLTVGAGVITKIIA